jgi:hypothetical protein
VGTEEVWVVLDEQVVDEVSVVELELRVLVGPVIHTVVVTTVTSGHSHATATSSPGPSSISPCGCGRAEVVDNSSKGATRRESEDGILLPERQNVLRENVERDTAPEYGRPGGKVYKTQSRRNTLVQGM